MKPVVLPDSSRAVELIALELPQNQKRARLAELARNAGIW
jgi:hypothetical protein